MNVFEFLAIAILILSCAGVVVMDRLFAGKRGIEAQLQASHERAEELLQRIAELERNNDDLRQQLEWNRRLIDSQDRLLQQIGGPSASSELPAARR